MILSAIFISLGAIMAFIGFILGVNPVKMIEQGYLDMSIAGPRSSEISPEGRYNIPAEHIGEIKLNWSSGEILIEPYEGKDIILEERGTTELNESNSLVYSLKSGVLEISEFPGRVLIGFSSPAFQRKDLKIYIPQALILKELEINSVSALLSIENLEATELEIDSVSGELNIKNLKLRELNVNSVSGAINVSDSEIQELEAETVSGIFYAELKALPKELDFESVSGSAEIYLPQGSEFSAGLESISGKLETDFEGRYLADDFIVGSGYSELDFETTSGNVKLYKMS